MNCDEERLIKKLKKYLCSYNDVGLSKDRISEFENYFKNVNGSIFEEEISKIMQNIKHFAFPHMSFGKEKPRMYISIPKAYYPIDILWILNFIKEHDEYDKKILENKLDDNNPLLFKYDQLDYDSFFKRNQENRKHNSDKTLYIENRFTTMEVLSLFSNYDMLLGLVPNVYVKFDEDCHRKKNIKKNSNTNKSRSIFSFPYGLPSTVVILDYLMWKRQNEFPTVKAHYERFDNIIAVTGSAKDLNIIKKYIKSSSSLRRKCFFDEKLEELNLYTIQEPGFDRFLVEASDEWLVYNIRNWKKIDSYYAESSSHEFVRSRFKRIFRKKCYKENFEIKLSELNDDKKILEPFYGMDFELVLKTMGDCLNNGKPNFDDIPIEYCYLYTSLHNGVDISYIKSSNETFNKINGYNYSDGGRIEVDSIVDMDKWGKEPPRKYSSIFSFSLPELIFKEQLRISVANIKMPQCDLMEDERAQRFRVDSAYGNGDIINIIENSKRKDAEFVVFPEFCVPFSSINIILNVCIKQKISVVVGVMHHFIGTSQAINYTLVYDAQTRFVTLKPKNYYPYAEKKALAEMQREPKIETPYYIIYRFSNFVYSSMTCFEATNIRDRGFLNNKINLLFMPVYNLDTSYFSSIIASTARDLSCYVVQSNNSEYGDSRITQPAHSYKTELVQAKGGDNNYFVIGTIDVRKLSQAHSQMEAIEQKILEMANGKKGIELKDIEKQLKDYKMNNEIKPLGAGSTTAERRKNMIE